MPDHLTSFFPAGRDRGVTVAGVVLTSPGEPVAAAARLLLIGVAAAALATGLASATAPSTVTGAGAGLCLLAFGLATLLAGRPFTVIHPMAYVCLDLNRRGRHERTVA